MKLSIKLPADEGKALPLTNLGGSQGCETSRLLHYIYSLLTGGGEVVSLEHWPAALYHTGIFLVLISVRGLAEPRAVVRLEGLGNLKNLLNSSRIE
jgi:hypothetical protein